MSKRNRRRMSPDETEKADWAERLLKLGRLAVSAIEPLARLIDAISRLK